MPVTSGRKSASAPGRCCGAHRAHRAAELERSHSSARDRARACVAKPPYEKDPRRIIGVGNCASSLVQGVEFYAAHGEDFVPGLMNVNSAATTRESIHRRL
jgi:hypothetical protein